MPKRIERQLQGEIIALFHKRIDERKLGDEIRNPVQEEERADILLYDNNNSPILFIELKDPIAPDGRSVFNYSIIGREFERSRKIGTTYFGICNFIEGNLIHTVSNEDWILEEGDLLTLNELNRLRNNFNISNEIESKLIVIVDWYLDRFLEIKAGKIKQTKPIDELFIYKLKSLIRGYIDDISDTVWQKFIKDKSFKKKISEHSKTQQWTIPQEYEEVENITYISILLLISKLIFYKALFDFKVYHIPALVVDGNITKPTEFRDYIWEKYFYRLIRETTGFELLIGDKEEIINQIPFLSDSIIDLISGIILSEEKYDFSKIKFDIIGRIFEELIREDERHKLGQYFTPSTVVDLINSFCIRTGKEKILDPSCGSGTFLVRAYDRKKRLQKKFVYHGKLISQIFGYDISSYATYLSILNLSILDMSDYDPPNIIRQDFFEIESKNMDFDAIIGNPPYTRQEEIDEFIEGEKEKINKVIEYDWGFSPKKNTSLYGHFFYHAGKMLKDHGYFGFITSNSWLDTSYGIEIQQWMLNHFKIVAIIDSKVERFFTSADVNTNITILHRVGGNNGDNRTKVKGDYVKDEQERDNNLVRFVYLKKKLFDIVNIYGNEDGLRDFIENTIEFYEDENMRIVIVKQVDLKSESKWGKFLRAPQVYWDIMQKGEDKWKALGELSDVRFGIKTGANEFFIVEDVSSVINDTQIFAVRNNIDSYTNIKNIIKANLRIIKTHKFNELWLIEKNYLFSVVDTPRGVNEYQINNDIVNKLLLIHLDKDKLEYSCPYLERYIKWGESKEYNARPSCESRDFWYDLGEKTLPNLHFNYMIHDVGRTFIGKVFSNNNFHNIYSKKNADSIFYFMNSSIFWLFQNLALRLNLGEGVGKIENYELEQLPICLIKKSKFKSIKIDKVKSVFEELGTNKIEEFDISKVNPERLKLDNLILETIGYTNPDERKTILNELYISLIDIIHSRLEKSKSVKKIKKNGKKTDIVIYVESLKELINDNSIKPENNYEFYLKLEEQVKQITPGKSLQKKVLSIYWKDLFDSDIDLKDLKDKYNYHGDLL